MCDIYFQHFLVEVFDCSIPVFLFYPPLPFPLLNSENYFLLSILHIPNNAEFVHHIIYS